MEPENNKLPKKKRGKKTLLILLFLILVIGTGVGIYLYLQQQEQTQKKQTELELTDLQSAQDQSDSLYYLFQEELEQKKEGSASLYPEIALREEALVKQYIKLQNLIRQAKQDQTLDRDINPKIKIIDKALQELKEYINLQRTALQKLQEQYQDLDLEKEATDSLLLEQETLKELLMEENDLLRQEQGELDKKIEQAKVLQLKNLDAHGAKLNNKGAPKRVKYARKTEFLQLCFDIVPNKIVGPGLNKIYLRILGPDGQLITRDNQEKHNIPDLEEALIYSSIKTFNYKPTFSKLCLLWSQDPNHPFQKGTYQLELYNRGQKIANSSIVLK